MNGLLNSASSIVMDVVGPLQGSVESSQVVRDHISVYSAFHQVPPGLYKQLSAEERTHGIPAAQTPSLTQGSLLKTGCTQYWNAS